MTRLVLFDLDGTLVDTARDIAVALNRLRAELALPPVPYEQIRPAVSHGSRVLIQRCFDVAAAPARAEQLKARFLKLYRERIADHSRCFPGIDTLLTAIEARGWSWGVVTNKPSWLTEPLLASLKLSERAATIISGDTTAHRKPHPEPLRAACRQAGLPPAQTVYVGDAERDIAAGRAAGTQTVIALFGYIDHHEQPERWGADHAVATPDDLTRWLGLLP